MNLTCGRCGVSFQTLAAKIQHTPQCAFSSTLGKGESIWVNPVHLDFTLFSVISSYVTNEYGNHRQKGLADPKTSVSFGFTGWVFEPGKKSATKWAFHVTSDDKIRAKPCGSTRGTYSAPTTDQYGWTVVTWVPHEAVKAAGAAL